MERSESDSSDSDSHSFSSQESNSANKRVRFIDQPPSSEEEEEEEELDNSSEWEEDDVNPLTPQNSNPLPHSNSDSDSDTNSSFTRPISIKRPKSKDTHPHAPLLSPTPHPQLSYRLNTPPSPVIPLNERAIDVEGLPHHPYTSPSPITTPYSRSPTPTISYTDPDVEFELAPLQVRPRTPPPPPPPTKTPPPPPLLEDETDLINNFRFLPEDTANLNANSNGKGHEEKKKKKKKGWKGLCRKVGMGVLKTVGLLYLLFMFVCSLDLLSLGFRLIGGRSAGEIFRKSDLLQNPVVGVMMGILTTVLVQSSSTSTSIIVGMVSAGFLEVPVAIPLIMGANIGTSITNTIVSFSQAGDRAQFRRAFAGATLLDMFNWLTVIVLLTVEVITGYLYHVTTAIMKGLMPDKQSGGDFQLLSRLTRPFVNLIVQLDRNVLDCWATPNCTAHDNSSLIRQYCNARRVQVHVTQTVVNSAGVINPEYPSVFTDHQNASLKCKFLFAGTPLSDAGAGAIILVVSLFVLCSCLILIVKLLNSVLQGQVAVVIQKTLNADIPYVGWLTGYLAILVGAVMTFLVQSSSVFTSALTPLIGLEVITVERAYPLTLGSNIGTTTTALLASMATEGKALFPSMQIALCHLLFNVTGILLFYPIPFLRLPIPLAKFLGKTTAKYRWFAILYIVFMFAILPAITIGLSAFGGRIPVILFCSLVGIIALFIGIVTWIQRHRAGWLPPVMRTWKWLPTPLRSLQPYDDFLTRFTYCRSLKTKSQGQGLDKGQGQAKGIGKGQEDQVQNQEKAPPLKDERASNNNLRREGGGDTEIVPVKRTNSYYEYEV